MADRESIYRALRGADKVEVKKNVLHLPRGFRTVVNVGKETVELRGALRQPKSPDLIGWIPIRPGERVYFNWIEAGPVGLRIRRESLHVMEIEGGPPAA